MDIRYLKSYLRGTWWLNPDEFVLYDRLEFKLEIDPRQVLFQLKTVVCEVCRRLMLLNCCEFITLWYLLNFFFYFWKAFVFSEIFVYRFGCFVWLYISWDTWFSVVISESLAVIIISSHSKHNHHQLDNCYTVLFLENLDSTSSLSTYQLLKSRSSSHFWFLSVDCFGWK